jgi:protein-S-isoprenylcysteine O-methyltransferase Ste14
MAKTNSKQYKIAAIKQLSITSIFLLIQIVIFILSAGNMVNQRPWLYFIIALFNYVISIAVQYKLNPQLLVQRLKVNREGSKLWDETLMRTSNLMIIIAVPAIAGLDVGRFQLSNIDVFFAPLGLMFVVVSSIILNYAMYVNIHFEPTVRIQKERDHKVVTSGPYSIIRHPGYLAGILFAISIPLLIGSVFTFIPVVIYIFLIVIRTWLEDRTLQKELERYSDYSKQVRYRLLPRIW